MLSKLGDGYGNTCPLLLPITSDICRFARDSRLDFRFGGNFRCGVTGCGGSVSYPHRFRQYKRFGFSGRSRSGDWFAGWHGRLPGLGFLWGNWPLLGWRGLVLLLLLLQWLMVLLGLGWFDRWYWLGSWGWLDSLGLGGKRTWSGWFFYSPMCWFRWWRSARLAFTIFLCCPGGDFLILLVLLFLCRHGRSMTNWFQPHWVSQFIRIGVVVHFSFRGETVSRRWGPGR